VDSFDNYARLGAEVLASAPPEEKKAVPSRFVGPLPEAPSAPVQVTAAEAARAMARPAIGPMPDEITPDELEKAAMAAKLMGADDLIISNSTPQTVRKLAAEADKMSRIAAARAAYQENPTQYDMSTANNLDGAISAWVHQKMGEVGSPNAPAPTVVDPFAKAAAPQRNTPAARPQLGNSNTGSGYDDYTPPVGRASDGPASASPRMAARSRAASPTSAMQNQGPTLEQNAAGAAKTGTRKKPGFDERVGRVSQESKSNYTDRTPGMPLPTVKKPALPAKPGDVQFRSNTPADRFEEADPNTRYVKTQENPVRVRRRTDPEMADLAAQESEKRRRANNVFAGMNSMQDILGAGSVGARSAPRGTTPPRQQTSGRISNSPGNLYRNTPTSAPLKNPIKVDMKSQQPPNKFSGVTQATKGRPTRPNVEAKPNDVMKMPSATGVSKRENRNQVPAGGVVRAASTKGVAKTSAETALKAAQNPKSVKERNLPARKNAIPMGSSPPVQNPAIPLRKEGAKQRSEAASKGLRTSPVSNKSGSRNPEDYFGPRTKEGDEAAKKYMPKLSRITELSKTPEGQRQLREERKNYKNSPEGKAEFEKSSQEYNSRPYVKEYDNKVAELKQKRRSGEITLRQFMDLKRDASSEKLKKQDDHISRLRGRQ
jgi:hypothetical protein